MSKLVRQQAILEVVSKDPLSSQDKLRKRLARLGYRVTQATLSRDIHDLGLVKTPDGYAVPEEASGGQPPRPSFARLAREFLLEVREAQNLLVLKTAVGSAQPVAAALDSEAWPEVVGTVAGDDTILIISSDRKTAYRLALRIREAIA